MYFLMTRLDFPVAIRKRFLHALIAGENGYRLPSDESAHPQQLTNRALH